MKPDIRKATWFYGILAAAALWIALTAVAAPPTTAGRIPAPQVGFLAPDFSLTSLDQSIVQLEDLRGKVVIINLWASWCLPCREEMPALQRVHEAYAEDGLVVLGVNMTAQDTLTDAEEFVRQRQLTFPILLDVDGDTARSYRMHSLPTTFFVDREGVIRDQVIGGPMPEALLRAKAIELLGSEP